VEAVGYVEFSNCWFALIKVAMSEVENTKKLLLEGKLHERINKESKSAVWKNISLLFFQESRSSQDSKYSGFALIV